MNIKIPESILHPFGVTDLPELTEHSFDDYRRKIATAVNEGVFRLNSGDNWYFAGQIIEAMEQYVVQEGATSAECKALVRLNDVTVFELRFTVPGSDRTIIMGFNVEVPGK